MHASRCRGARRGERLILLVRRLTQTPLQFKALRWHNRRVEHAKSIVLIGFMGAGKSSVGRWLQTLTGLARIDTDELIAQKLELSIPEIFSKYGEEHFRDAETDLLRGLAPERPAIIVTGGGIILRTENVDLLKRLGAVVWLDAPEEVLFERATRKDDRPLLQTEEPGKRFAELFKARRPIYQSAADLRIDTSTSKHTEIAEAILTKIDSLLGTKK
jgi:shikimate kinase